MVHVNLQVLVGSLVAAGEDDSCAGTRQERIRGLRELQNLNCPFLK